MTLTFDNRVALEEAIASCSSNVRLLQEKLRNDKDSTGVDDLAEEVKKLVELRKELQAWKLKEENDKEQNSQQEEEEENQAGPEQEEENEEQNTEKPVQDDVEDVASAEDELVQRATRLEGLVAAADDKLTAMEMEVAQIDRTKAALTYLVEHQETTQEETKESSEETIKKDVTLKKKKNKKKKGEKKIEEKKQDNKEEKYTVLMDVDGANAEEADTMTEKRQQDDDDGLMSEEKAVAVPLSNVKTDEQVPIQEHTRAMQKAKQEFTDMQQKLLETIASMTEEKNVALAKLKAELDAECFNLKQACQEAETKLQKHVALLTSEKEELEGKLETAKTSAKKTRDELEKAQAQLTDIKCEQEAKETHLGSLWKNVENLQLANKKLTEKNASIEADTKAIRAEAEKTIAEHMAYKGTTDNLTAEVEAAKAELERSKEEVEKLQAEVDKLTSEMIAADSKVSNAGKRILTLEQELETTKKIDEDRVAELEALRSSASATDSRVSSLNEQIQALNAELELTKQNAQEVTAEHDALLLLTQEAKRTYTEEIDRLTTQMYELQSANEAPSKQLEEELEQANNAVKAALAEKDEVTRQLHEMKSELIRLKLEAEQAQSEATRNDSLVKKLAADLEARTAELNNLKVLYTEAIAQRSSCEDMLQDLRGVAATNEELLKKARMSLLEANEELKDARANALKWKNSAQAAKTMMKAKIADAEAASKQLKKARADISSSNGARVQLTASLEAKDKKVAKLKQELATGRAELAEMLKTFEHERLQSKLAQEAQIRKLREISEQVVTQLNGQIQSYRLTLAVVLPMLVGVVAYAIST